MRTVDDGAAGGGAVKYVAHARAVPTSGHPNPAAQIIYLSTCEHYGGFMLVNEALK